MEATTRAPSETEERLAKLEAAAADARLGFWEYDVNTGRFTPTPTTLGILGLDAHEPPDLETIAGRYGPESDTLLRALELSHAQDKPFVLTCEIVTPAGNPKWVRTQGRIADRSDSDSRQVVGTIQDISDIRLLDRVTRESAMTLHQVEQITHIGHWSVSLADGSFFHSDEVKRIFGYEPSEYALSVEEAINAYHPDDREAVIQLFNRAVETGEGYEFNLRIVQPSGDVRHVHSKGYTELDANHQVSRVYGVFQDITDQVAGEAALRESEAWMKSLIDAVGTAIVVHDRNGEIVLSNRRANTLLGPLTTDIVGRKLDDPVWQFEFEDGRRVSVDELPVSVVLATLEPVENMVLGWRQGETIGWLLVNGVPVFAEDGALSRIIVSFVDISDRREMEERLHQSEKMRAIGQLAGGVAHDFNNQLMVISNFAEILRESVPKHSEEYECAGGILAGVAHSAKLTGQLLAYARKGKYMIATVDINALVSEVASIASRSFDKKIGVTHRTNANPATVLGDASQLQNALLNAALNARDAMPDGGKLVFTTDTVTIAEGDLETTDRDARPGEYVRVTVHDTGTGMSAATRKHIFEPFFTTKERGKGTGMGMASVYGTVKSHHGAIDVASAVGQGTTVTILLPLTRGEGADARSPVPLAGRSRGRILVIDDEEDVTRSLGMILRRKGYEITTSSNGREGLEEFRSSWQNTDLVLLDMIMPEMNGMETFYAMKALDPAVKVLLLSGYSFTDEAKRFIEDGGVGFLVKPIGIGELMQAITRALGTETPN